MSPADPGSGAAGGAPGAEPVGALAEEDAARAETYALLARLLLAPPPVDLLARLAGLRGDDTPFGMAAAALAQAAGVASPQAVKTEYDALFVGLSKGELQPYASYYRAGGLYRKPLAELRGDMARLGIARDETSGEPEDHIGTLCEIMAGLILGGFGAGPADLGEQRRFFQSHVETWAPQFFSDLEGAKSAAFYVPVGRLGGLFLGIERLGFDLAA